MERFLKLPLSAVRCPICGEYHSLVRDPEYEFFWHMSPKLDESTVSFFECTSNRQPIYYGYGCTTPTYRTFARIDIDSDNKIITLKTCERQFKCPEEIISFNIEEGKVNLNEGTISFSFRPRYAKYYDYRRYCLDCPVNEHCELHSFFRRRRDSFLPTFTLTFLFDEPAFKEAHESYKKEKLRAAIDEILGEMFKDKNVEIGKLSEIIQETLESTGDISYL